MAANADRIDTERRRGELPFGMEGRDEAVNYFAWQAKLFEPWLKGTVIDHGAGTGGLSTAVRALDPDRLVAVEPDAQLVDVLHKKFNADPKTRVVHGTLDDWLREAGNASVDLIVSSNVLEHIEDDGACLRVMHALLKPGGAVGIYVPARPELFGSLDEEVGHYRRYTKRELGAKLRDAGFDVARLEYRNLVAVIPWLVTGRILRRRAIPAGNVKLFDRLIFPVFRRIEDFAPPAYGLNLVAVGTKR